MLSVFVPMLLSVALLNVPPAVRGGTLGAGQVRVLHSFGPYHHDGWRPSAGLVTDNKGALYGTTFGSGYPFYACADEHIGCGTVFKMTPAGKGYTIQTIYRFEGGSDGAQPESALIVGTDGSLFGTTSDAGYPQCGGTAFKLSPTGNSYNEQSLTVFSCPNPQQDFGGGSSASVIPRSNGVLFGTRCSGGQFGQGDIFSLTPSGNKYAMSEIFSFPLTAALQAEPLGACPQSALLAGDDGSLYGVTAAGGAYSLGVIFKLVPTSSGYYEEVLYNFTGGSDGANPEGPLIEDSRGILFGVSAEAGGGPCCRNPLGLGTVFSLTPTPSGYVERTLHTFLKNEGAFPNGGLYADKKGDLYGTTPQIVGDGNGNGLVYKLTPSGTGYTYRILHEFTAPDDAQEPNGGLIAGPHGDLYGTSSFGGTYGIGTVFEIST